MKIRASMLDAAAICPGVLELAAANEGENAFTSVGTLGHKAMQLVVTEGFDPALEYLRDVLTKLDREWAEKLRPEDINRLIYALEDAREWLPAMDIVGGGQAAWVEEGFELWLSADEIVTGHVDYARLRDRILDVTDWKFYNQTEWLPPIERHLQMLGYGLALWRNLPEDEIDEVRIHRVNVYRGRQDQMTLTPPMLVDLEVLLAEVVASIRGAASKRITSALCTSCLWRRQCPDRAKLLAAVDTSALTPYKGGAIVSDQEALRFLLAKPVLKDLLFQGDRAVKEYVTKTGRPLVDQLANRTWGPHPVAGKREIVDVGEALEELKQFIGGERGKDAAYRAMDTTLAAIERELMAAKFKPADRKRFMDGLFKAGFVTRGQPSKKFSWTQIRRELAHADEGDEDEDAQNEQE